MAKKKRSKEPVNEEKTLVVFHIAKTGGNTIEMILKRKYSQDTMLRFVGGLPEDFKESLVSLERLSEEDRRRIRCVWDGPFFGIHKYLPQSSTYFTFLRDPIKRVVSEYYWVLGRIAKDDTLRTQYGVESPNMSLKNYVKNGVWRSWNCQTRILSRVPEASPPGTGPVLLTSDDLKITRENLRQYFIIGLLERFDESLILLKRTLAWKTRDILYVKKNISKKRPTEDDYSRETIELIEKHNELDIQLYEFAKQLFEERISQQDPSFRRELLTFRLLNAVFGPVMNIYDKLRLKVAAPLLSLVKISLAGCRRKIPLSYVYQKTYDYLRHTVSRK